MGFVKSEKSNIAIDEQRPGNEKEVGEEHINLEE